MLISTSVDREIHYRRLASRRGLSINRQTNKAMKLQLRPSLSLIINLNSHSAKHSVRCVSDSDSLLLSFEVRFGRFERVSWLICLVGLPT